MSGSPGASAAVDDAIGSDAPAQSTNGAGGGRAGAMGATTVGGFAVMLGQTLGTKAVNAVGQVVLAWLLAPEHFGLIVLAYTMMAFTGLVQQFGLREVLVHRRAEYAQLASPATWLAAVTALIGAGALVALAPAAAWFYDEPRVTGLMLVLALATPFATMSLVPETGLQIAFRFRLLAAVGFGSSVLMMGLTVLFAALDFGAYSFVLPRVIVNVLRCIVVWSAARPAVRLKPEWGAWRGLIGGGMAIFVASLLLTVISQGDYMIMGRLHSAAAAGIYFFAFGLSMQTVTLLSVNLSQVLLPVLSALQHEPARQRVGFLRAARLLTLVAAPICFLQAAVAEPIFKLVIDPSYYAAIAPLAALSVGMYFRITWGSSRSLTQSLGMFIPYVIRNAVYAVVFLALVAAAALWAGEDQAPLAVALAVMAALMLIGPMDLYLAVRPIGGRVWDVVKVYAPPALIGVGSIGLAWALAQLLPENPVGQALRIGVIGTVGGGAYAAAVRVLRPGDWVDLKESLLKLAARSIGRKVERGSNDGGQSDPTGAMSC